MSISKYWSTQNRLVSDLDTLPLITLTPYRSFWDSPRSLHLRSTCFFIDFEKAFDSWGDLRRHSKEMLIAIIRATHDGIKNHVLHRGKICEEFEVQSKVRRVASCQRYCFFLLLVTFSMLPCPEDLEEFTGLWHLFSNTSTMLMASVSSLTGS